MKYEVNLKKAEFTEPYERDKTNVMSIYVDKKYCNNNDIKYNVKLSLSKNAMLGLGKALIRYAHTKIGRAHV